MSGTRKITVRVDGSAKLGMGHVMRCIHITEYLERRLTPHPEITFVTVDGPPAITELEKYGEVISPESREDIPLPTPYEYDRESLPLILNERKTDLLIIDCNWGNNPELTGLLPEGLPVISIHEHNFPALMGLTAAINPSLVEQQPPPGYKVGWTHFQGPDYLILDEQIPNLAKNRRLRMRSPAEIVVCLGGADPDGYTLRVVDSLSDTRGIRLQAIIGPAFSRDAIVKLCQNTAVIFYDKPSKIVPILADCDMAITNGATSMLESIALGVPTIALPRNPYEAIQGEICAQAGAVISINPENIERDVPALVNRLISDRALRLTLSAKGRSIIDGFGLSRVGNIILRHLKG